MLGSIEKFQEKFLDSEVSSDRSPSPSHPTRKSSLGQQDLSSFKTLTQKKSKPSSESDKSSKSKDYGLHLACLVSNIGIVKFALDQGQSINSAINGMQAIHICSGIGDLGILKFLLQKGANPNARRQTKNSLSDHVSTPNSNTNSTPLHFAVANNHFAIVESLLAAGANPTIQDEFGVIPIDISIHRQYTDISRILGVSMQGTFESVDYEGNSGSFSSSSKSFLNHESQSFKIASTLKHLL